MDIINQFYTLMKKNFLSIVSANLFLDKVALPALKKRTLDGESDLTKSLLE